MLAECRSYGRSSWVIRLVKVAENSSFGMVADFPSCVIRLMSIDLGEKSGLVCVAMLSLGRLLSLSELMGVVVSDMSLME